MVVWPYFLNAPASVLHSKQHSFSLASMSIPTLPITHPLDNNISKAFLFETIKSTFKAFNFIVK